MGKRKSRKRIRARSSSSSSSTSSTSTKTPSPPPPRRRKTTSRSGRQTSKPNTARTKGTDTVSQANSITLNNIIPEFDPLKDDIDAWLSIIKSYANTFSWSDETTRYQALNKLKGPAKTWYDSLLRSNNQWPTWNWFDWCTKLSGSFQIQRNMFELLKEVIERKPSENQSLYEFYFDQKCRIDRLNLKFSDLDIISIILGNIGDGNIEVNTFKSCDQLASALHGRTYKPKKQASNLIAKSQAQSNMTVTSNATPSPITNRVIAPDSVAVNDNKSQINTRKIIKCFTCGGNHKRSQCSVKCDFCGKRGHVESSCYHNKSLKTEQKPEKQETKFVSSSNSRNKFVKRVHINDVLVHDAFVDTGSSCSLISESLLKQHGLHSNKLPSPVTLQGFSKHSAKIVNDVINVTLKLDSVCVDKVDFYVMDDLVGCDILIGRNVTERPDLIYSRIGDVLQFDYARKFIEFCGNINEVDIDADSHHAELIKLLRKFSDSVARNVTELGKVNNHEMVINVTDPRPIQCRPFRSSYSDKPIIRDMVNELLANNIVRESNSPYASPALLVDKKNGEKRLCIDYRALNKVTVKDKYPMPRIEDLVDRLQGSECFTSLDLKSGYYQILMSTESIPKTAFITEDGHYEFLRMPFGLVNAPSCFQQMMNKVLGNLRFGNVIVYLDDVYLVTQTVEQNLQLLEQILQLFRENGLTLNLKKCHFFKTEIEFLGYKIKPNTVMPNDIKLEAVKCFPTPKTVHQLRQFLGLISYFRKFIKNCAMLSTPLTRLLKKDSSWVWDSIHEQAFQTLKNKLTSSSVLSMFDPSKDNVLYTDASREGVAGILMQVTTEGEKPIHYYSRQTTDDEKRYHSFELELLAIVSSLQKFRLYLLGSPFKIITDCNAVRYALTKKDIIPRIARWVLSTQEFSFEIFHREGTRMQHVDALSRNPVPSGEKSEHEVILSITEADWLLTVQVQDQELVKIKNILESGQADENKDIFDKYELLGHKVYRRTTRGRRWVVPKKCIWQIIRSNHDDLGHFSVDKTVERIENLYWFPRVRYTVKKYIKNCINCIYFKNKGGPKEGGLHPLPKFAQPFHTLHMDHLGPFVTTKRKNKYLLVIVDAFTKFVFIFAVKSTASTEVIKELEHLSKMFGNPRRIITDAGTSFTSKEFSNYCNNKNIRAHTVATGMPRSNGQAEIFNKTILNAIRTLGANTDDDCWDDYVKILQQGLNSTIHKTTKAVPSEVFFGYRLRTDNDNMMASELDNEDLTDLSDLRKKVDQNIKNSAIEQKKRFDNSRTKAKIYNVGDLVLIKIQSKNNDGQSTKLMPIYKGPFRVSNVLGHDRYEVTDVRGAERSSKPYRGTAAAENMKPWIRIDEWTHE